jgi:hypothetical protein
MSARGQTRNCRPAGLSQLRLRTSDRKRSMAPSRRGGCDWGSPCPTRRPQRLVGARGRAERLSIRPEHGERRARCGSLAPEDAGEARGVVDGERPQPSGRLKRRWGSVHGLGRGDAPPAAEGPMLLLCRSVGRTAAQMSLIPMLGLLPIRMVKKWIKPRSAAARRWRRE